MSIKTKKTLAMSLLLVFIVACLFMPYVYYQSNFEIGIFAIFGHGFNWLILVMISPFILLITALFLTYFIERKRIFGPLSIFFCVLAATLFIFSYAFYSGIAGVEESEVLLHVGPIFLTVISIGLAIYTFVIMDKSPMVFKISIYEMVEISVFVAIAVVLDRFAQIDVHAGAGSIGFAMLPLMIITLRHGPIKGFIASGVIFGFITCLTDGWGFIYFPFDYLLGFGSIALLGLFKNLILPVGEYPIHANKVGQFFFGILFMVIGVTLVMVGRTLASSLSSMIFYGYNLSEALIYQMTYVPGSCGACLLGLIILYKPLLMINRLYRR